MHQVIPGADVFHSFVTKLHYVPQAKCSCQLQKIVRGLLGLDYAKQINKLSDWHTPLA